MSTALRVVLANRGHRVAFLTLWREYLMTLARYPGAVLPTGESLAYFASLFDSYTARTVPGVVLLGVDKHDEAQAVLCWGSQDYPFHVNLDRPATGWGTYVRPSYRRGHVALGLRREAARRLLGMGFATMLGTAHVGNEAGTASGFGMPGAVPIATQGLVDLSQLMKVKG